MRSCNDRPDPACCARAGCHDSHHPESEAGLIGDCSGTVLLLFTSDDCSVELPASPNQQARAKLALVDLIDPKPGKFNVFTGYKTLKTIRVVCYLSVRRSGKPYWASQGQGGGDEAKAALGDGSQAALQPCTQLAGWWRAVLHAAAALQAAGGHRLGSWQFAGAEGLCTCYVARLPSRPTDLLADATTGRTCSPASLSLWEVAKGCDTEMLKSCLYEGWLRDVCSAVHPRPAKVQCPVATPLPLTWQRVFCACRDLRWCKPPNFISYRSVHAEQTCTWLLSCQCAAGAERSCVWQQRPLAFVGTRGILTNGKGS